MDVVRGLLTLSLMKLTILEMALLTSALMRSMCPSILLLTDYILSKLSLILAELVTMVFSILLMVFYSSSILSSVYWYFKLLFSFSFSKYFSISSLIFSSFCLVASTSRSCLPSPLL